MNLYDFLLLIISIVTAILIINNIVINNKLNMKPDYESMGLKSGAIFPKLKLTLIDGTDHDLLNDNKNIIVLFTAINCSACSALYQDINTFTKKHSKYSFILFVYGKNEDILEKIKQTNIDSKVYILKASEGDLFETRHFPFCYILDKSGKVINKTIPRNMNQIQSLL